MISRNGVIEDRGTSYSAGGWFLMGLRKHFNYMTIDGLSNMQNSTLILWNNNIGPDFISEFKVATSAYSAEYGRSVGHSFLFSLGVTTLALAASLFLANLANQKIRGLPLYRTALLWTYGIAPPVSGIIWLFVFHPSYGVLPYLLSLVTAYEFNWLLQGWVAMLLVIFDVEVVFLLPWAVNYISLGLFGFVEMMLFLGILLLGYAYLWRNKGLQWD